MYEDGVGGSEVVVEEGVVLITLNHEVIKIIFKNNASPNTTFITSDCLITAQHLQKAFLHCLHRISHTSFPILT